MSCSKCVGRRAPLNSMGAYVLDALGSGVVAAALLSVAAWLGKQQISAWLNKDLERLKDQNLRELEAKKAEYQRELEAYRASLIAAAERTKAEAEVKKAGALRIVEKRFAALDRLHAAVSGHASECISGASMPAAYKTVETFNKLHARRVELQLASVGAEVFLLAPEYRALLDYRAAINPVMQHCMLNASPLEGAALEQARTTVLALEIVVDRIVRHHIEAMMQMK